MLNSVLLIVLFNGFFVNSLNQGFALPLPFYSLLHAQNNSGIAGADVEAEIIKLDNIAENYINPNSTSEIELSDEDPFLDFEAINSYNMVHQKLENKTIELDCSGTANFYEKMTFFMCDDDVCLGFETTPDLHIADVRVHSENGSTTYYLKQMNMMLNKAHSVVRSLEVYSIFVRRGMDEYEALSTVHGVIVVRSNWIYKLRTEPDNILPFTYGQGSADAFYVQGASDSNDASASLLMKSFTMCMAFVIVWF